MTPRTNPPGVRTCTSILALALLAGAAPAQIRSPGEAVFSGLSPHVPSVVLDAPDVAALLAEDLADEASGRLVPLRYGIPLLAPLVVEDLAAWEVDARGERLVARLRVTAPGAYSLGLEFSAFELTDDAQLFLYDESGAARLGAYTAFNAGPDGALVIEPFPGESLILEYSQPAREPLGAHLALRGVIYDYKDVFALERGLNTPRSDDGSYSAGCTVGVNCPEGDPFDDQKRATVRTLWGGYLCSGVILNNTAGDRTPYLYTANHCGTNSGVVVRFGYEQSGCLTGPAPTSMQMSGATLLDADVDTDGRLLRLNNAIPDSYDPYYAGWSRSTSALSYGMSMHHPAGAPKEISIDVNGGGGTVANFYDIGLVKCWNIDFQIGGTDGGSSGGPLFDEGNFVRGVLTGGPDGDCYQNYYGRIGGFWNDDDIGEWLDPLGTGLTSLVGLDPFADLSAAALVGVGPASGPAGGFTGVTLSGSGFDGVSSVTFGGVDALDFQVLNDSSLAATTPPGPASTAVDVTVTDSFGSSTLVGGFFYTPNPAPQVDTISPAEGNVAGGLTVSISGVNVLGVTDVQFGGVSGTGLQLLDANELTVVTPEMPAGVVDVTVIGNGSDVLVDGFTFENPGAFIVIGTGLPGQFGITPMIFATGDLLPGGAGFDLDTLGLVPYASGAMFFSFDEAAVPFKGGTLYTLPILATFHLTANSLGQVNLGPLPLDASVPGGISFVLQQAFVDAAAVAGVSLTAGLRVVVGEV